MSKRAVLCSADTWIRAGADAKALDQGTIDHARPLRLVPTEAVLCLPAGTTIQTLQVLRPAGYIGTGPTQSVL